MQFYLIINLYLLVIVYDYRSFINWTKVNGGTENWVVSQPHGWMTTSHDRSWVTRDGTLVQRFLSTFIRPANSSLGCGSIRVSKRTGSTGGIFTGYARTGREVTSPATTFKRDVFCEPGKRSLWYDLVLDSMPIVAIAIVDRSCKN